jgi:hypothetical protein
VRLLLRGGGCEEAALRMIRPMRELLALKDMNRRAGHLYSNKHTTKAHQSAMVAIRFELYMCPIAACEWKQTCCGGRMFRLLALWRMRAQAGHLHSSKCICSEHRFMQEPGRNRLVHACISVCAGVPAAAGGG